MNRTIIHVDMDAFFAAVEVRDNPDLAGKPLIIGALPHERGVVSTCSYEARKFGVRSAMSIKDACRRCPQAVYMHPNINKYKEVSSIIHQIWCSYTDIVEYLSLDEGYLDVTGSLRMFHSARAIGVEIKDRTKKETGLTCSVGIGYSMATAKLASEEKKPDGFFEIPDPQAFRQLTFNRSVRELYSIGSRTAEKLAKVGIHTVKDILYNRQKVTDLLGSQGEQIVQLANGIDNRQVTPYYAAVAKSIGREHTFQQDITDFAYLKDVLRLLAKELSMKIRLSNLYSQTITLKVTYGNMKSITRSKSGEAVNLSHDIYQVAAALLDTIDKKPIRLVGISLSSLTANEYQQISITDLQSGGRSARKRKEDLEKNLLKLQQKYGAQIIKTAAEMEAEKHVTDNPDKAKEPVKTDE